ncbi:MAG: zinc transporter ZntB [Alphaproteobacteria bacterium]
MNQPIMHAYQINGDGTGTLLEGDDVSQVIRADQLAWVHLDATMPETREWLMREVSYLDPLVLDALLADETRPRVLEHEQGILMILRGVNLNENSEPEDMVSIRLWADSHRIISLRRRKLKAVQDLCDRLESGRGPKNSGEFIAGLSNALFERMEPVFSELDERLDDIEEKALEHSESVERRAINKIRRQAIIFRRYVAPQKDAMALLRNSEAEWLDVRHRRRIQEAHDRLTRYVEDLDAIRERAQIIKEEISAALADTMNKNMYILSVIAAVFLPLGFLTGLLGINVGGIPGADYDLAFAVFCGLLAVIVLAQIVLFKFKKWF